MRADSDDVPKITKHATRDKNKENKIEEDFKMKKSASFNQLITQS